MIRESVIREFRDLEREPIIVLDRDKDIAPMLEDEDKVFLDIVEGISVSKLVEMLEFAYSHDKVSSDVPLSMASRIVFELTVRSDFEFPLSALKPLSDYLSSLPNQPDIVWGCARVPSQNHNVKLKIIFTI